MAWLLMKKIIELILGFFTKKPKAKVIKINDRRVDKSLIKAREDQLLAEDQYENDPIAYKNNQKRLGREHNALRKHNRGLYDLLIQLDEYVHAQFDKNVIITMIYRTQGEQDYLYRNSARYKKKKFKSPHQFWHAVDIRSRTFTHREIDMIVRWLNREYNKINYYKWTAKCHDVGSGMHFHIQFSK